MGDKISKKARQVNSVETACQIIEELYEGGETGLTELAGRLDMSKAAVYQQVMTLCQENFVVKENNRYRLSYRFLDIGQEIRSRETLLEAAQPELEQLAEETGENAHLMVEQNGWGYILLKETGKNSAATTSRPGRQLHLHYTSTGKAILANLPRSRVERIIEERGLSGHTDQTITDEETLFKELAEIRNRGIAFDRGEQFSRARCVGAPIRDTDGGILGAISISGPRSRFEGGKFEEKLPRLVLGAAEAIEMNIEIDDQQR